MQLFCQLRLGQLFFLADLSDLFTEFHYILLPAVSVLLQLPLFYKKAVLT